MNEDNGIDVREIEAALRRRSADLSACTGEFLDTIEALRKRGQADVETIWNTGFHVNLIDHDLSSCLYFSAATDEIWARRLVARTIATLLFEATEDLPDLFGKRFMDACRTAGVFDEFEAERRKLAKKLGVFRDQHGTFLKEIRVTAGAHHDSDAITFIRSAMDADPEKLVGLACQFMELLKELGPFCMTVITRTNAVYRAEGVIP